MSSVDGARSDRAAELVEVTIGVIGRPHGVRGELAVQPRTDEPERRFAVGTQVRAETGGRRFTVSGRRQHQGRLLLQFEEIDDRTAAEGLRGTVLVTDVPADEQPAAAEEFYDRQLVGLAVLSAAGREVGTVRSVLHLPAQDLLEIATADGERLVPFVTELVPEIDLAGGRLLLADVPGLLADLDDATDAPGPAGG